MHIFASPHLSGCGAYIEPPTGHFRIFRTPGPEIVEYELDAEGDVVLDAEGQPSIVEVRHPPILQGYVMQAGRKYLDWDVPTGEEVTYRLEVSEDGTDGSWRVADTVRFTLVPETHYSALEDGGLYDVVNPRDALVVFLGTRLAALARQGALYVRSEAHKRRYRVTTHHEFGEAEVPIIAVGLAYGTGHAADLGWTMTEEHLKLVMEGVSYDKRERDSLTRVLRGLIGEISWFLEDLGCVNVSYGELTEFIGEQEPNTYRLTMAIGLTAFTHVGVRSSGWSLLPQGGWVSL